MMSKEEVAEIITYCREHKVRQCDRLKELGIAVWRFYDARRKYASESEKQGGEFLQLTPGGTFVPSPMSSGRTRKSKTQSESITGNLSIEMRTVSGTMMRIQGEMSPQIIRTIIESASGSHV